MVETLLLLTGDVRNDVYLTLVQGEFAKGSKTSDKNVEVTVCVCNSEGKVLPVGTQDTWYQIVISKKAV